MRRAVLAFVAVLLLVGVALGGARSGAEHRLTVTPVPAPAIASGPSRGPGLNAWAVNDALRFRAASIWSATVRWNQAVASARAAAAVQAHRSTTRAPVGTPAPGQYRAAVAPSNLAGVVQCIKDHESGNYAESSHPGSGSGAYQFIPGTWRTYFGKWAAATGYTGPIYAYAYQAPPDVQDAVLIYALTHGGAGNWSPKFGDDPCTVGMGG